MSDERRPKILLSLDGGGAKGWSQLDILYDVIKRLKERKRKPYGKSDLEAGQTLKEEDVFPCDYFVSRGFAPVFSFFTKHTQDLIVGSGTGGINAILVGRLGLSIGQCRKAWKSLDDVFKVEYNPDPEAPLFSAEKLENWAKALVKEHTGDSETMMLIKNNEMDKPNNNQKSCRVYVNAISSFVVQV